MTLLVDTSVWSLALRRDQAVLAPQVVALQAALQSGDDVVTTGIVLQALLQGFAGPKAKKAILAKFAVLPCIAPDITDYVDAAGLRNICRRSGVQIGTIDALLAQICIRREITLLTADGDFSYAARHCALRVWSSSGA